MQYQGGEVVVGFFFDGADGQQPVIFGTLFRQSFIKDELTSAQFNAKKQTCFVPYTPPKVNSNLGKNQVSVIHHQRKLLVTVKMILPFLTINLMMLLI